MELSMIMMTSNVYILHSQCMLFSIVIGKSSSNGVNYFFLMKKFLSLHHSVHWTKCSSFKKTDEGEIHRKAIQGCILLLLYWYRYSSYILHYQNNYQTSFSY